LLTLEVAAKRNIPVAGIVYNYYPEEERQIVNDSKTIFRHYLKKLDFPEAIVDLPVIEDIHNLPEVDFSEIFEGII
jgi:dethiobiotin synthetase